MRSPWVNSSGFARSDSAIWMVSGALAVALSVAPVPARASQGYSISEFVAKSDAVALARIEALEFPTFPAFVDDFTGSGDLDALPDLPRGKPNCRLRILRCIKGHVDQPLVEICTVGPSPWLDRHRSPVGKTVLAFLQHTASRGWQECEGAIGQYIIPDSRQLTYENADTPLKKVIGVTLDAVQVPGYDWDLTVILHARDPRIPVALRPLSNSPNLQVRDMALSLMIENGDLQAIPAAIRLHRTVGLDHERGLAREAMRAVHDPGSVPYFNEMLVSWDVGDRIIASSMLQRVGGRTNRSSIPYLVLALGDPDDQVAYGAYRMLSELVPDLGVPDDIPYWTRHRRAENERFWLWWNDELNGRHRDVPDPATQSAEIGAVRVPSHQPDQRQRARVALFSPALQVRREAVSAISQAATADDIPFLVLAMYDPDTRIAFQACTLLHRLLKLSGTTPALIHFANHRGEDSAPARSWWQSELRGDHVTDVKLREQIGLPRLSDLETRDRHIAR